MAGQTNWSLLKAPWVRFLVDSAGFQALDSCKVQIHKLADRALPRSLWERLGLQAHLGCQGPVLRVVELEQCSPRGLFDSFGLPPTSLCLQQCLALCML